MTLSSLFRSPYFRVPFLAFAVISTVATSQAEWTLDSTPVDEDITVAPKSTFEKKVQYEASQNVGLNTDLTGKGTEGARVQVQYEDSSSASPDRNDRPQEGAPVIDASADGGADAGVVYGCDGKWRYEWAGKQWRPMADDGRLLDTYAEGTMFPATSCDTKTGTVTIKITNESDSELKLHLKARVKIGDVGDSDPPSGAFVRGKVDP